MPAAFLYFCCALEVPIFALTTKFVEDFGKPERNATILFLSRHFTTIDNTDIRVEHTTVWRTLRVRLSVVEILIALLLSLDLLLDYRLQVPGLPLTWIGVLRVRVKRVYARTSVLTVT
jgi:hypothetical protein